ncbi:MAG TPA: hypothetical protein VGR26_17115 [Acidimicrobiales bacterium]|nr:hypothetical protein [Acidimicrobiales bacterium]
MGYRVDGWPEFDAWEAVEKPSDTLRLTVLDWIAHLADDPTAPDVVDATPVAGLGLPVHTKIVPGTRVGVAYCVARAEAYEDPVIYLMDVRNL